VKCQKILLTTFNDDRAPKTIKVFVNRPSLDFGDADRDAATQTFVLQNEPVGGEQSDTNKPRHVAYKLSADSKTKQAELELHFVKFQKVTDLTLFVADNIGGADTSVITQLDVLSSEKMVFKRERICVLIFGLNFVRLGKACRIRCDRGSFRQITRRSKWKNSLHRFHCKLVWCVSRSILDIAPPQLRLVVFVVCS
jgi:hypothetical protein